MKLICQWLRFWASAHFLPVHRLKGSARTQVMEFQRSYTKSPCPLPESCHVPGSCYPALRASSRAGKITEWVCSLMENYSYCPRDNREISSSRPPQKGTKRTNRRILQEIHCPARSTLFIINGLPCLCLRNKTKKKENTIKSDTEVLLQNFFCKTEKLY